MRKLVGCRGTTKGKCPTSLIIQLLCIGVLIYLLYGHPYATIEDLCLFGERNREFIKNFLLSWLTHCLILGAISCLIFGDSRIISPIRKFLLLISCHLSVEEEWVLWSLSQSMRGVRNQRGLMSIPWLHLLRSCHQGWHQYDAF